MVEWVKLKHKQGKKSKRVKKERVQNILKVGNSLKNSKIQFHLKINQSQILTLTNLSFD
jgi:hypothetical protein